MAQEFEFIVRNHDNGERLDTFLTQKNVHVSRSQIKRLIDGQLVQVNSTFPKAGCKVKKGDLIRLSIPEPIPSQAHPENIPLDIIFEDSSILLVNKPPGLVVHPASGNHSGTLVNALLYYTQDLSGIGGVIRPGIVHRLDKNTSGIIIVAKDDIAHQSLARQFKEHSIKKTYIGLVYGTLKDREGIIQGPIGRHVTDRKKMSTRTRKGKKAVTYWKVIEEFEEISLLEIKIETGRTHQIRVHLADMQHPIIGDPLYCGRKRLLSIRNDRLKGILKGLKRQALHAQVLGFHHPGSGEYLEFTAPLVEDIEGILHALRSDLQKTYNGRQ
ncbi:MAG: RluA family pseudouridine synthase [Thermodesulfobacteriota bacterium]|nr:RluA family pseudouridine synthase [Thermodesulfobacteriota bacterium]